VGNTALQVLQVVGPGAFAPVMLNVAFVLLPFGLVPLFAHWGVPTIYAMAVAALAGGLLQVLVIRPALRRNGMLPRPVLRLDASTRALAPLFLPQLVAQGIYQINTVFSARFLSSLPEGAVSFYSYAQRLADIPQGLFAVALSGAAMVALQRDATRRELHNVARTYERSLRMAALVALPMTVLLAAYAEAIIPIVYGYGRFRARGASGVHEVAVSLRWQAVGIAFLAFVHQTTAVFGVLKRRRDILGAAFASLVTFITVGALAKPVVGHQGVAMAMAASSAVQLAVLLITVRKLVPVRFANVGATLAKTLFATGMTALAATAAVRYLPVTGHSAGAKVLAIACGGGLVGLYVLLAWVLRCEELTELVDRVRGKLQRRRRAS
jgi:putative peptidoglycan lipid II flippase